MSVGLLLEGGGMRGLYTAGVLDVMLNESIKVDGMVTVSSGALFGVNYASQQKGRVLRYNIKYIKDKRYISISNLLRTGNIISTEFAYKTLPFVLDKFDQDAFTKSKIDFYVTVTNVETGEPEYILIENGYQQIDAFRASGSIPFVSKFVDYNGCKYLDGGVSDSIPLQKAQELGYEKIIVILTQTRDYQKPKYNERIIDMFYKDYPQFGNKLKHRHEQYNKMVAYISELEDRGELFVIRPSKKIPIGLLERNPDKLQSMYDLGYADAVAKMDELKIYLKSKN